MAKRELNWRLEKNAMLKEIMLKEIPQRRKRVRTLRPRRFKTFDIGSFSNVSFVYCMSTRKSIHVTTSNNSGRPKNKPQVMTIVLMLRLKRKKWYFNPGCGWSDLFDISSDQIPKVALHCTFDRSSYLYIHWCSVFFGVFVWVYECRCKNHHELK